MYVQYHVAVAKGARSGWMTVKRRDDAEDSETFDDESWMLIDLAWNRDAG